MFGVGFFLLLTKKGSFFWVMRGPGEGNVSGVVPHPVTIRGGALGVALRRRKWEVEMTCVFVFCSISNTVSVTLFLFSLAWSAVFRLYPLFICICSSWGIFTVA